MNTKIIEERKNRLDLRPAMEFVDRHIGSYTEACQRLTRLPSSELAENFCLQLKFESRKELHGHNPQVSPNDISKFLSTLPPVFLELSCLRTIDYVNNLIVPVPVFEEDGTWNNVDLVPVDDFPRQGDHPSRILIGRSTGYIIYPTALPVTVWVSSDARWFYQLHVFLHEFFHTIEYLRRTTMDNIQSPDLQQVVLYNGSSEFTLQDWWDLWVDMFSGNNNPLFVTRYAASYADSLNAEMLEKEPTMFNRALAEQICESFVGYILGIAPNDEDEPDFKKHSPMEWGLMDNLAKAILVR